MPAPTALLLIAALSFGQTPRLNEVTGTATHNSYWVKRSGFPEAYASGTQERLLDQLLFDQARGLEIDVHKDRRAGEWRVYHTEREGNVLCSPFEQCLKQLRQFQYALPNHEPVIVVIELKNLFGRNWDKDHKPSDFDRILESELGPYLYRPRDLLSGCRPGATLKACVKEKGWPRVDELRGKFLFAVLGNWRWHRIGHGVSGWADYATADGGVAARSAWPMATDISDPTRNDHGGEYVPPDERRAAYDASVLLQIERSKEPAKVAEFLADGGIVRVDDAFSLDQQRERAAWGAQYLQTDSPWLRFDDRGPAQPLRPLKVGDLPEAAPIEEPGERIFVSRTGAGAGYTFDWLAAPSSGAAVWETLPSTTRPSPNRSYPNPRSPRGKACLRAEGSGSSIALCRRTDDKEFAVISVETERGGRISTRTFRAGARSSNGIGDQLRLEVEPREGGRSCAEAYSASEIGADGSPSWKRLAGECFEARLERQGVSAKDGDVLFVRTRLNGAAVSGAALQAPQPGSGYALADLTVPSAPLAGSPMAGLPSR
jgi:hypothetical protein